MQKIWLSSPHMSGHEEEFVAEAFKTNWIAPLGPNVDGFENDLAKYNNIKHVAALSSGTAAIHLALILLGIKENDEVLVSTFTFSATINPIIYQKAIPILIESEADTWNMSPKFLEEAIIDRLSKGKKPKAILLVHLYGMPAKMQEIMEISEKYDIPIIEDAAEALGSKYDNQALGTFGELGIFSFNGNKIITTSGGGALVSDNKEYIDEARFLATQARDNAPHYQHSHIGYNYRMSNVCAGIGRGQMMVIDKRVQQRRAMYDYYNECFSQIEGISLLEEPSEHFFSNRWLTTILVNKEKTNGITREEIRLKLEEENIESRPLWKPMHLQPIFSVYPYYGDSLSDKLFEDGLCLPSGSNLNDDNLTRISKALDSILS